jgi:Na+/melibiose symporter-like transporter
MNRAAFWFVPVSTATLALAFYGSFGAGRDYRAFMVALLLVPLLGVVALVLGVRSLMERMPERKADLPKGDMGGFC